MKIGVSFRNGIGNFIIFTSVLQALADYSNQPIDLIISKAWQGDIKDAVVAIAKNCYFIDKVVIFPNEFEKEKYDKLYVSRHGVFYDPAYHYIIGDKDEFIDRQEIWARSLLHEIEFYYFEIERQFDYKGKIFPQFMPFDESYGKRRIKEGFNIAVSNSWGRSEINGWRKKSYPHWLVVLQTINEYYSDARIWLLGGEDDEKWGREIEKETKCNNLIGKTNILETASIVNSCDILLSIDTGIYHIADALKKPGVVLFGPTLISKNGPLNRTILPIRSPLPCAPCQGTVLIAQCTEDYRCMGNIAPGLVFGALDTFRLFNLKVP